MALRLYFKCGECGECHDDEDDARECCMPLIKEVFLCPICRAEHDEEIDAVDCCGTDEDFVPPPTAKELEDAGQLRLPL